MSDLSTSRRRIEGSILNDPAMLAGASAPAPTGDFDLDPADRGIDRGWRPDDGSLRPAAVLVPLVLIGLYRFVNPPVSALMLTQKLAGISVSQRWVPLEAMSRDLVAAEALVVGGVDRPEAGHRVDAGGRRLEAREVAAVRRHLDEGELAEQLEAVGP